jgi:ATP-dependent DNA helicase PIF1
VQVILVGDFLQLPPVATEDELEILRSLGYRSQFAFSARALDHAPVQPVELEYVFRQGEMAFIDVLARIRTGQDLDEAVQILNRRCTGPHRHGAEPILLTPTRAAADRYNWAGLNQISGPVAVFDARIEGKLNINKSRLPVPERVELKVGARVMAAKNDSGHRWVNGSLGTVTAIDADDVTVRFDRTKDEHRVGRAVWEKVTQKWDERRQRIISSRIAAYTQVPLVPAWAITIHKAQGLTLDDVRIDLGYGAWAPGQVYVALSRARTLDGLSLTRKIRAGEVKVDPILLDFVNWLRREIASPQD